MKKRAKQRQVGPGTLPAGKPVVRGPTKEDRLVLQSFAMNESNWVVGSAGMYADVKRLQSTAHEARVILNKEAR